MEKARKGLERRGWRAFAALASDRWQRVVTDLADTSGGYVWPMVLCQKEGTRPIGIVSLRVFIEMEREVV
jgi:hypothetical protein